MKPKFIVWGHKNNSHTHSYIHSSYYKASKYLGFESYWLDGSEDLSNFNFDDSIFFTEDQVQHNIPLNKSSKYILHHTNLEKYKNNDLNYINLANYLKPCDQLVSAYHAENNVERINDFCYWDEKTKTVYQPWATDLLPNEIDINDACKYNPNNTVINYVGTVHENSPQIFEFTNICNKHGITFNATRTNSDLKNKNLIQNSYLSLDLRGLGHIEVGYLPCRVFKNISYGRITGTNSENVKTKLGDHVVFDSNIEILFEMLLESEKTKSITDIQKSMIYIKYEHTFINRINNLLKFI
jgi:hypothetical protein